MKYATNRVMNVRTVRKLQDNEGFTLRYGKIVEYKSGWQVACLGKTAKTPEKAMEIIRDMTKVAGAMNVGVWFSDGIYYIDFGSRIPTKKQAIKKGENWEQQSIYSWGRKKMPKLLWLEP